MIKNNSVLLLFILLVGCGASDDFPSAIDNKKSNSPVEKVEDFVNKRLSKIERALLDFKSYYVAVNNKTNVNINWFTSASYLNSEKEISTKEIVSLFQKSPEGAYLTEQDNIYIQRLISTKLKAMKERMEVDNAVRRSMLLAEKEENYSESELQSIFMNIAQAKLDIINIQQNKYSQISHSLKKSLDSKNAGLWQAIKDIDYDKVKELTKEKSYDSIIIPIISLVIYKKENTWSLSDKEKIVVDILNQAYTAYPYGYIKVSLDDTGINSYMSDKELSKIYHKVSVSLDI